MSGHLKFKNVDAEKFGMLAKFIYNLFFRKKVLKAVNNSENTIDDKAFQALELLMDGK